VSLPISICILAKDEDELIVECIESVSQFVREIIVLDTGSSDGTIELATRAGASVFQYEWEGDFSKARNHLISLASEPYIFMLDADERFTGGKEELENTIKELTGVGQVKIVNYISNEEQSETYISRIFKNKQGYYYDGVIHEQLMLNGMTITPQKTRVSINHLGYQKEIVSGKRKLERNIALLKKQLAVQPHNPYVLFQLGRTFYVQGDYTQAVTSFLEANRYIESSSEVPTYYPSLVIQLAYSLMKLKQWDQLKKLFLFGIEKYPEYTDLYFMYGVSIIESKNVSEFSLIPQLFTTCLELGEPDSARYETVLGVGSFKALFNLGLFYEIIGDSAKSFAYYQESAEMGFDPAQKRIDQLQLTM